MGEVIVITSGKGGVGKTTSAANIGAALSLFGQRVVIIDTDLGLRKLDIALGVGDRVVYDLVDVIYDRCSIGQALVHDKRFYELYVLPASQSSDKSAVNPQQMKELCNRLKTEFDYILIDSPAGMEQGFVNAVSAADRAVVVIIPEPASVRDADRIIDLLAEHSVTDVKLLINRLRSDMVKRGDMLAPESIIQTLGTELVGIVPEDDLVISAVNKGKPVILLEQSRAALCFKNIARRLMGEDVALAYFKPDGLWKRLKKAFKNK